jgi:GTP-binding nuclear protein Ran
VWDTAGQEAYAGLNDGYYLGSHGAVLMFDITVGQTFKNIHEWLRKVRAANPNIPVIVCANKVDLSKNRKVDPARIWRGLPRGVEYTDISVKSGYNYEVPLLYLARKLTGNPHLTFEANINILPAEIVMDPEAIQQSREVTNAIKGAQQTPLPDENEDAY